MKFDIDLLKDGKLLRNKFWDSDYYLSWNNQLRLHHENGDTETYIIHQSIGRIKDFLSDNWEEYKLPILTVKLSSLEPGDTFRLVENADENEKMILLEIHDSMKIGGSGGKCKYVYTKENKLFGTSVDKNVIKVD